MSLTYPEDRSYHSEHLWAKSEPDGTMLVGITDYAQDQLGGVIFVDLPAVGEHFKQGVSCASIESVKITSDAIIPGIRTTPKTGTRTRRKASIPTSTSSRKTPSTRTSSAPTPIRRIRK